MGRFEHIKTVTEKDPSIIYHEVAVNTSDLDKNIRFTDYMRLVESIPKVRRRIAISAANAIRF